MLLCFRSGVAFVIVLFDCLLSEICVCCCFFVFIDLLFLFLCCYVCVCLCDVFGCLFCYVLVVCVLKSVFVVAVCWLFCFL